MKFSELRALIAEDYKRLSEFWTMKLTIVNTIKLTFMPAMTAILLYRFSHYLYVNNMKILAWPLWAFNLTLTGAEILPASVIGPGVILGHPTSTIIAGRLGKNVTLYGQVGIGGGIGDEDVGGGKGLPCIGDNVTIGIRSMIVGPVTVGDGASVAIGSLVNKNVPPGAKAIGSPCRIVKAKSELTTDKE